MILLAWRNLVHDRVRLAVTVTGIVFAVVLIVVELGLYLGFTTTTSSLVDRAGADLWITAPGVPYVELGVPFTERKLSTVLATPGVAAAGRYITRFSEWKRPDGRRETVQVVGVDLESGLGLPWNLVEGTLADLRKPDAIFVDEFYRGKLGVSRVGDVVEIRGRLARVAGFTRGIRAFTTAPYIFTAFRHALDYGELRERETMYLLVKAADGHDIERLRRTLGARLTDVAVVTAEEFSRMTRFYWMFSTGAGIAVLLAAALGLIVGFVIVAQTIYATTVDHLREYGTLKAMGASHAWLHGVIVSQALISALIGYVFGIGVSAIVVQSSEHGGAAILLPGWMAAAMLAVTAAMCVGAAIVSISKVRRLDPALVFKG